MNSQANPNKINNQSHPTVSNSRISLGQVLRDLKKPSYNPSSRSSQTSNLDQSKVSLVAQLYRQFQHGTKSVQTFKKSIQTELSVKLPQNFERVLSDPNRSYKQVLASIKPQLSTQKAQHYTNPRNQKFLSSTSLTTLPRESQENSRDFDLMKMNQVVRNYIEEAVSKQDLDSYLHQQKIPVSVEFQKCMREHQVTKSVPFYKFARAILQSVSSQGEKQVDRAQQGISGYNLPPSDQAMKFRSRQEQVKREYDKIGNGNYVKHKRKVDPRLENNGDIFSWNPSDPEPAKKVTQEHLQEIFRGHQDIFRWTSEEQRASVSRKALIPHRATVDSGNFINWNNSQGI